MSNGQIHGKHWPQRLDDVGCWMLGETSQFRQIVLGKNDLKMAMGSSENHRKTIGKP